MVSKVSWSWAAVVWMVLGATEAFTGVTGPRDQAVAVTTPPGTEAVTAGTGGPAGVSAGCTGSGLAAVGLADISGACI